MSGFWRLMLNIPPFLWEKQVDKARRGIEQNLGFMSPEHRRVHHFVVRELPRQGRPLDQDFIAGALGLAANTVGSLLDDLESRMTFLYRNEAREVHWAYPVTVEPTPHRVTFSSGESLYAA
jgi:hypothetical protein